jgi:hypothetical protein
MENIGVFSGFEYGTRVYVTTPGGRREGFTFEPVPVGGFAALAESRNRQGEKGMKTESADLKNTLIFR